MLSFTILIMALTATSCATSDIKESGQVAIHEDARHVMETFQRITSGPETANRSRLRSQLEAQLPSMYSLTWTPAGDFQADVYLREHLTRGGGWFAEQRTVQACVRYTSRNGSPSMHSITCTDQAPLSGTVDEDVTVP